MKIIVVGGGVCGLGTALLLARDGHEITLLEQDADRRPEAAADAWEQWGRQGVAQFRQPHNLMPGLRLLLESDLPDVQQALGASGATRWDLLNPLPPFYTDRSPRPIDDQLWTWTARRPTIEWVFARAVEAEPRITLRRGVRVKSLANGVATPMPDVPHVTGVCTTDDEHLRADLVVDATGRASRLTEWLHSLGARPPDQEQEDCGFIYYTRYFRGTMPQRRAGTLTPLGSISLLTLFGDHDTWSVTVFTASGDQPLKALRHAEPWTRTIRACPLHAHWLDGEPITDVLPMAGVVDRYRRLLVDDRPVATGIVAVADAWACTNPSAGRGLTVGFLHARVLRDVLRETAGDAEAVSREFDRRTEHDITPWYRAQIAVDRARFAEMAALREGRKPEPPADELARGIGSLFASIPADPDLFRAALEYVSTITPAQQILAREEVREKLRVAREQMRGAPPPPVPGPNRQQLLELLR